MIINGRELIDRLIACGYTESNARDICEKYAADGKYDELRDFVLLAEQLYDDRREYV